MEVKTQMMQGQINTMFKENLSAKMKEIRESMSKKFNKERDESLRAKNRQIIEEEKTTAEEEVKNMMSTAVSDGMHKSLLDRQAPSFVSNLKMQ